MKTYTKYKPFKYPTGNDLESLRNMELVAKTGVPAWENVGEVSQKILLYDKEALELMGYYKSRLTYGSPPTCKCCDILLPFTSEESTCAHCNPDKEWGNDCYWCGNELKVRHNFKVNGQCCIPCSKSFDKLVKRLQKTEDLDLKNLIRVRFNNEQS